MPFQPSYRPFVPLFVILVLVSALAGGAAGAALGYLAAGDDDGDSSRAATTGVAAPAATVRTDNGGIVEAVNKAGSSVVTVVSVLRESGEGDVPQHSARGSGVIVDKRGYVVTNEHVIEGAENISVILASGDVRSAELVGTDRPFTDLAVLKLVGNGEYTEAELADSDGLQAGQVVVAIGSALGDFRNSVTMGVVSGLHRTWTGEGVVMEDLIQTDASINHGNSGGALVNAQGQVVGISTSVIRTTESGEVVEGMGFAIPSNTARAVAEQLVAGGKVLRPYFGIVHQDVTPYIASIYDLPVKSGAHVMEVAPDTPAARAGLRPGDVIVQIGAFPVDENHPFLNVLMKHSPNDVVKVVFFRGDGRIEVDLTLAERR